MNGTPAPPLAGVTFGDDTLPLLGFDVCAGATPTNANAITTQSKLTTQRRITAPPVSSPPPGVRDHSFHGGSFLAHGPKRSPIRLSDESIYIKLI
jgi:hypothetical protein